MNDIQFHSVSRQIESLTHSTDLIIETGSARAIITGRNSPFLSHRRVEYCAPTDPNTGFLINHGAAVLFSNSKYSLLLWADDSSEALPDMPDHLGRQTETLFGLLPPTLLYPLIDEYLRYFEPLSDNHFNSVIMCMWAMPILSGYDDNGRPIFVQHPSPTSLELQPQ